MPLNHTLQNRTFYVMCCLLSQLLSHIQLFCDPMDCRLPGSSVHGISQARILEWVAVSISGGLPDPRMEPTSPALAGEFFIPLSGSSVCNAGDPGLIPGLGRSLGEGNGNQSQYSCLENPINEGAWRVTVIGDAKSQT